MITTKTFIYFYTFVVFMANALSTLLDPILPNKDMTYTWVEWQAIYLFLAGIVFSFADISPQITFVVMLITGLMFGRLLYRWNGNLLPYFIFICVGFLFGYVLLSPQKLFLIGTYFAGVFVAYQLHKNKVVESVEW